MASLVNADKERQYRPHLVSLMKYLDGRTNYTRDTMFSCARLLQITPEDILWKFNHDVFGVAEPPACANHNIVPKRRCHTIKAPKRALLYYMPNNRWFGMKKPKVATQCIAV